MGKFVLLKMLSIVLVGTGNLATHLHMAFSGTENIEIRQIYGRNPNALKLFEGIVATTTFLSEIIDADVYILAVSDRAILEVSKALGHKKGLVCHTSGSVSINAIHGKQKGVFYPLQTFTKGKSVDFSEIPICIEAENERDVSILVSLGKSISAKVYQVSSKQREKLHLSAVLVNNFPNHLFGLAEKICHENDIPFQWLWPLIEETIDKVKFLTPKEAQTGPAKRNDVITMQRHLSQLENPLQKKIYQLLSESIKITYEKEL